MIYLLYGDDDFTIDEALVTLRSEVGLPDVRDVNTAAFDAAVSRAEMMATCDTVPFLADKRLVIVRGLLTRFERHRPSRSRSKSDSATAGLGEWEGLSEYLERVPETTDLVFVDSALDASNPLLKAVQPHANSRLFSRPNPKELRQWIRSRVASLGADIESKAVDELAETIGGDLRIIDMELQKLSLYRWGETVRHEDVQEMVSYARECNVKEFILILLPQIMMPILVLTFLQEDQ